MSEPVRIDIEEPGEDLIVLPLEEAIEEYLLSDDDVQEMKDGKIIWVKDTAFSLHEED